MTYVCQFIFDFELFKTTALSCFTSLIFIEIPNV